LCCKRKKEKKENAVIGPVERETGARDGSRHSWKKGKEGNTIAIAKGKEGNNRGGREFPQNGSV